MPEYCTADELKAAIQSDDTDFARDDALFDDIVVEASQAIDDYCHRTFEAADTATARLYHPDNFGRTVHLLDDISATDGLVVEVDRSNSGSFTTLTITTDYWLETDNLTGVITGISFVDPVYKLSNGRRNVQVTAKWGWPTVPTPIHRAALILSQRLFSRKDSVDGVLGFDGLGATVRLSRMDPDVQALLAPYVKYAGLLA